jgi:ABC-2 type transport system ATP-binding protein
MENKQIVLKVNINRAGYRDKKNAIENMSFTLQSGELIGLIGSNGAGKSTTIKAILGLLQDWEGEVAFGTESTTYAYIPEQTIYYDELTLWEHMELAAVASGIRDEEMVEHGNTLLEIFRMAEHKHFLPSSFSKGMQQKLMIILAFLRKPDVYIVDEPFVGLDPMAMKDFLRLLDKEQQRGAGILMSTHILDTAEKICTRFLLVENSQLIAQGTLKDIQERCASQSSASQASLLDCYYSLVESKERI